MSAKMATQALLKIKVFEIKVITSYILSMTSPTNAFHMNKIILWTLSCDPRLATLAFV